MDSFDTIIDDIRARDGKVGAFVEFAKNPNPSIGGQFQAKTAEDARQIWTFAIKSNIAVEGLAHTAGIGGYRHRTADADAFCVSLLRRAGGAIVGTVNMEEAALGAVTNNPHFGKTHNPLRHGYTAGGSSGGSAAAVAAGLVRVALGTDTMGSCRIPAAYCGVVGFKPSFGRISAAGVEPLSRRLDHVGILTNSVADIEAVFDVVDVFDRQFADAREYPRAAERTGVPSALRVAVLDDASKSGLDADVRSAYDAALDRLRTAGVELVARPMMQQRLAAARRAGLLICEAELATSLAPLLADGDGGVSPHLRALIAFGESKSAPAMARAHAAIDDAELVLREQLEGCDAICWPTAPQTAFSFDAPVPSNQADFTCLANFTGAPAISIPLPVAPNSLPAGLQLISARGDDRLLLKLAARIATVVQS